MTSEIVDRRVMTWMAAMALIALMAERSALGERAVDAPSWAALAGASHCARG